MLDVNELLEMKIDAVCQLTLDEGSHAGDASDFELNVSREILESLWMEHVADHMLAPEFTYSVLKNGFTGMRQRSDLQLFCDLRTHCEDLTISTFLDIDNPLASGP